MAYTTSRNPYHDYRSKSVYLITLAKAEGADAFSLVRGGMANPAPAPGVQYLPLGKIISAQMKRIPELFEECRMLQYVIMPDHVHFVIEVKQPVNYHLGKVISKLTGEINKEAGAIIFNPGYHDRILYAPDQLRRMIDYVKDNPRRHIIKTEHREFFTKPMLAEIAGKEYAIYGNINLLSNPCISQVRFSRSFSPQQLASLGRKWEETIRSSGVLVSPFVHPLEKEWKMKAMEEGAKVIMITREELSERWKPYGRLFDLCAEGRLLIISSQRAADGSHLSMAEAMELNGLAEAIAGGLPKLSLKPWVRPANSIKRPSPARTANERRASGPQGPALNQQPPQQNPQAPQQNSQAPQLNSQAARQNPQAAQLNSQVGQQNPQTAQQNPQAPQQKPQPPQQNSQAGQQNPQAPQQNTHAAQQNTHAAQLYQQAAQLNPQAAQLNSQAGQQNPQTAQQNPQAPQQNPQAPQQNSQAGQQNRQGGPQGLSSFVDVASAARGQYIPRL